MKTSKKKQIAEYNKKSLSVPTTPPRLTASETKYAKQTHWGIPTGKPVKRIQKQPHIEPKKRKAKMKKPIRDINLFGRRQHNRP